MANKDYHQIMTEITSQLTGNTEEDIRYLTAKCEEYKTHEMAKEILRGIGRLMYDIIPEDKREEINQAINNDSLGWKAALDEANFCIYKKDFYKAREILESLISKLEDADMYADDEITVYKDFNETFEDVLFLHRCRSEKKEKVLKGAGYPYATIYTQYGGLLFELGEHTKAIEALRKARKWNPISADIAFELAENYKATGDLETFLEITKEAYAGCFREKTLARYYRNLAFYYSEKKRFREATACIMVSGHYDNTSANIQSELYYIQEMNGGERVNLTRDDIDEILETEGISPFADRDVLGLAGSLANNCVANEQWQAAEYFLEIFYDLTDDDEAEKELAKVRRKIAGEEEPLYS
jgi:tetratricopeptide (TPR) repeat protein